MFARRLLGKGIEQFLNEQTPQQAAIKKGKNVTVGETLQCKSQTRRALYWMSRREKPRYYLKKPVISTPSPLGTVLTYLERTSLRSTGVECLEGMREYLLKPCSLPSRNGIWHIEHDWPTVSRHQSVNNDTESAGWRFLFVFGYKWINLSTCCSARFSF